jgi:hypothetical protein
MSNLENAWKHFCTITRHKNLVMVGCFKVGLYRQGLLHDLSKYSPTEFLVGCKYYQGNMSPNNAERKDKGYSLAWLHHKGRNKHHLEYWIDYEVSKEEGKNHSGMTGMKMPVRYVVEMFIDRISASKNYQKEQYTDESALIYFNKGRDHYLIHEDTEALLEYLLTMLAKRGEKETFSFVKYAVLTGAVVYEKEELKRRTEAL